MCKNSGKLEIRDLWTTIEKRGWTGAGARTGAGGGGSVSNAGFDFMIIPEA